MRLGLRAATIVAVVVLATTAYACVNSGNGEPTRPRGISPEARYIGGADGGVYVNVLHVEGDAYEISVYLDSGLVAYEGNARLASPNLGQIVSAADVVGWDGEILLLMGGRSLVPLEPIKPVEPEN